MLMSRRIIPTIGEPPTPLSFDSALELSCHLSVLFRLKIGHQGLVEFNLSSWTHLILTGLCYALVLCHSFKGCALPPSFLFHPLFPIQTHKVASTIFWRDNQKIAGLGKEILYNIQPPNPTQYWSHWRSWGHSNSSPGGRRRSSHFDLPRNRSLKGCHA